ncbi:MAG: metallophosphoesterase [Acetobacteraceae bacterium]|nr:metallophosphoesterase [Acetobacteraceae bacterium]
MPNDPVRPVIRRRTLLGAAAGLAVAGVGLGAWTVLWEPALRLRLVHHRVAAPGWPAGLPPILIACVADPHLGPPHTPPERLMRVIERVNALGADLIVLLGDYLADHRFVSQRATPEDAATILAGLRAPLGVHAVLGNHDWWEDPVAGAGPGGPPPRAAGAFAAQGLPVLHNAARPVRHHGQTVWIAGLGSQWAYRSLWRQGIGADDLAGTLRAIPDPAAPVILLAHEPDIFPRVPARVAVTLAGHTHGGQVRLAGWSPVVPSRYGNRFAWGHVREDGRDLVVSGGVGQSILPVRLGMPSEITLVTVGPARG